MTKSLIAVLGLVAGLSACGQSDLESASEMSETMEKDPTAAGMDMSQCANSISMLKEQGAPEAAINGLANCQPGQM